MPMFAQRYRERDGEIACWLRDFGADALREWARGLGVDTFVGTSGRVFPTDQKAAPLLRGWVRRLRDQGVDRKGVVSGKRVSVRVDLGGRLIIKKNKKATNKEKHAGTKST